MYFHGYFYRADDHGDILWQGDSVGMALDILMNYEEFGKLPEHERNKIVAKATSGYDQQFAEIVNWAMKNPETWFHLLEVIAGKMLETEEDDPSDESRIIDLAWVGHKFISGKMLGIDM